MWCLESLKELNEKFEVKSQVEAAEGDSEFEEGRKSNQQRKD